MFFRALSLSLSLYLILSLDQSMFIYIFIFFSLLLFLVWIKIKQSHFLNPIVNYSLNLYLLFTRKSLSGKLNSRSCSLEKAFFVLNWNKIKIQNDKGWKGDIQGRNWGVVGGVQVVGRMQIKTPLKNLYLKKSIFLLPFFISFLKHPKLCCLLSMTSWG